MDSEVVWIFTEPSAILVISPPCRERVGSFSSRRHISTPICYNSHLVAQPVGKSKSSSYRPKVAADTIALIRAMAKDNRLWGAERIRGALLKLGLRVCKRTIQKYMRGVRTQKPRGQKWATFLRNHAGQVWACDFLQVSDLFFRPLFAFFLIERKLTEGDPRRRDTIPYGWLGGTTTERSDPVWASTKVADS